MGVAQALISIFAEDDDRLRSIIRGRHRIAFVLKAPLYLFCVSDWGEPEHVVRHSALSVPCDARKLTAFYSCGSSSNTCTYRSSRSSPPHSFRGHSKGGPTLIYRVYSMVGSASVVAIYAAEAHRNRTIPSQPDKALSVRLHLPHIDAAAAPHRTCCPRHGRCRPHASIEVQCERPNDGRHN